MKLHDFRFTCSYKILGWLGITISKWILVKKSGQSMCQHLSASLSHHFINNNCHTLVLNPQLVLACSSLRKVNQPIPTHYLPYIFTSCIPVAYPTISHYIPLYPTISHYIPLYPTISHYTILYPHCVPIVSTCGWYSWYSRAPCYSQVLVSAVASGCRAFVSWKACRRTVALPHGLLENPSSIDVGNI